MGKYKFIILILFLLTIFTFYFFSLSGKNDKSVNAVLSETLSKRGTETELQEQSFSGMSASTTISAKIESAAVEPNFKIDENTINILILGTDARHNSTSTRCDAIHMLSLNVEEWKILITSVPRGTYTYIEGHPQNESYMANACAFLGIEPGRRKIERLVGVKADYIVTIGFSQTYGILRQLKIPIPQTIQWLRNRRTFAIGDHQRSRNQALFIKDFIIKYVDLFGTSATLPIEKVLFSYLNTDMDFASARALLTGLKNSKISTHPEKIELAMKPYYETKDHHYNFEDPNQSLSKVGLKYVDAGEQKPLLQEEQKIVIAHIKNVLKNKLPLTDIMKNQLWRQIEAENERESLHFEIVKRYSAENLKTEQQKINFISEYIVEKEILGLDEWAAKGKELMESTVAAFVVPAAS